MTIVRTITQTISIFFLNQIRYRQRIHIAIGTEGINLQFICDKSVPNANFQFKFKISCFATIKLFSAAVAFKLP